MDRSKIPHVPNHNHLSRDELITQVAEFLFIASREEAREVLSSAENDCLSEMLSTVERLETE